jgi:hypothetical protein
VHENNIKHPRLLYILFESYVFYLKERISVDKEMGSDMASYVCIGCIPRPTLSQLRKAPD